MSVSDTLSDVASRYRRDAAVLEQMLRDERDIDRRIALNGAIAVLENRADYYQARSVEELA